MSKYEVSVVECPARHLIGMNVQSSMSKAPIDCPAIWQSFGPRMGELCAAEDSAGSFGVSVMLSAENFVYWAALEAKADTAVPRGMGSLDIPAGLYAKVRVPNLEKLGEGYCFIYNEWPGEQSEYIGDETIPCFEYYPPDWQPEDALEIFMAVKKR